MAISITAQSGTTLGRFNTTSGGSQYADGIIMSQDYPLEFNFSTQYLLLGCISQTWEISELEQILKLDSPKALHLAEELQPTVTTSSANSNGWLHFGDLLMVRILTIR